MHPQTLVVLTLALSSCYATVNSSSAHLSTEQSTAAVSKPIAAVATDVIRMFAVRNMSLTERRADAATNGVLLRFLGGRRHAGGEGGYGERHTIDSIYYVRLVPSTTTTEVEMMGRPEVDGVEACTKDPGFERSCSNISPPEALTDSVDGYEEAQVIRNVLVELRLEPGATR